ncbi:Calx-beta domain-containing protein [Alkalimarinus alittae]|uniref:Calx-beta domain-containing protein n=1 Tax=Alkalimarinus alittae TaxID=2961619 RepID=A0ABY6N6U8_9ALTE|nr:Calx-beta domain-containing protein [Alkalimarinus alittae]UZE97833.1 hypothetical protein NKI27_08895 [Alkalimarinus alittae]
MRSFSRWAISLAFLAVLSLLSACSETKSADTPSILGTPPKLAYIDVLYEYEFGADGGDKILTYRIIDAPKWLKIESTNGAKPAFRIYGVPKLENGENFNTYEDTPFNITLEVTDGSRSQQFSYKVTLQKNKVDFALATVEVVEGAQAEEIGEDVFDKECKLPSLKPKTVGGKTAYPLPIFVTMAQPSVSDVTLRVSITTAFTDSKDSRDISNIRSAQADIDYNSEEKFVTLKAGVQACLFAIDIFDDNIIEATESFDLTLIEATEGWVEHERPGKAKVNIVDDEPSVDFTGEDIVLSEGETSKKYDVTLSEAVDYQVSVEVFADEKLSTATADDYTLSSTTLTFEKGTTKKTFSVKILTDPDAIDTSKGLDETIVIKTDVSDIFELVPLNITINEWIDIKQTASSVDNKQSHALITDSDGNVVILNSIDNATKDVEILFLDRRSNANPFTNPIDDSTIESTAPAGDDTPVAMDYMLTGSNNNLVVVIETTGKISETAGETHLGLKDIFVRKYTRKKSKDYYEKVWERQIGTDKDDVPTGVYFDPLGDVIVYGYSEGSLPSNTNAGGKDAFMAKLDKDDGSDMWTKLIGSGGNDIATGATYNGISHVIVGTTTGTLQGSNAGSSIDGFIVAINDDGTTKNIHQFGTISDDQVTGVTAYNNLIRVAGYSEGDFTLIDKNTIDPNNPRNSIDGYYIAFNTAYSQSDTVTWGDNFAPETTTSISSFDEKSYIGGLTEGTLTGETTKGGPDATLIAIDSSALKSNIMWRSQFGTGADDQVISLDSDKNKVMVLWETNNGGPTSYNITPFSSNGKNLTE